VPRGAEVVAERAAAAGRKTTRARAMSRAERGERRAREGAPRWELRGGMHGEQRRGLARSGGGMGAAAGARCTERPWTSSRAAGSGDRSGQRAQCRDGDGSAFPGAAEQPRRERRPRRVTASHGTAQPARSGGRGGSGCRRAQPTKIAARVEQCGAEPGARACCEIPLI